MRYPEVSIHIEWLLDLHVTPSVVLQTQLTSRRSTAAFIGMQAIKSIDWHASTDQPFAWIRRSELLEVRLWWEKALICSIPRSCASRLLDYLKEHKTSSRNLVFIRSEDRNQVVDGRDRAWEGKAALEELECYNVISVYSFFTVNRSSGLCALLLVFTKLLGASPEIWKMFYPTWSLPGRSLSCLTGLKLSIMRAGNSRRGKALVRFNEIQFRWAILNYYPFLAIADQLETILWLASRIVLFEPSVRHEDLSPVVAVAGFKFDLEDIDDRSNHTSRHRAAELYSSDFIILDSSICQ